MPRVWADLLFAAGAACLASVLLGPLLVGEQPFAEGAGLFFRQIWWYVGITLVAAFLGALVVMTMGKDWKSQAWKRYADRAGATSRARSSADRRAHDPRWRAGVAALRIGGVIRGTGQPAGRSYRPARTCSTNACQDSGAKLMTGLCGSLLSRTPTSGRATVDLDAAVTAATRALLPRHCGGILLTEPGHP